MKKKLISIGLAAVMTAALFPVTAMAGTTTYVNKVVQVENGDTTDETSLLVIKDVNGDIDRDISNGDPVEFTIELDGAEWRTDDDMINNTSYHDVQSAVENYDTNVYFTKVSNNKAVIEINNSADNYYYYIPLYTTIKTDGDAVIALDGRSSVVTGGTFTFASPTGGSGSGSGGNTSGGGPLVYVNKTVTLAKGDETNDSSLLVIKDRNNDIYNAVGNGDQVSFAIELNGAEWINDENMMWSGYDLQTAVESYNDNNISFTKISSTKAEIEINNYYSGGYIYIPLFTVIRSKGNITLTVNGRNSVIPSGTYTYAVAVTPSVSVGIAGTKDIPEYGTRIKDITFSESVAGSLETGVIKLKLSRGFRFDTYNSSITKVLGDGSILSNPSMISDREIEIYVEHTSIVSALEFILKGINVTPDDAQVGDTASITVSGAGITPTTFDVGTYVDSVVEAAIFDNADIYGNVEIPVMYAGKVYDDKYHTTLPIQVSESTAGSLNASGSLTFTFPEGVK
ncbi:MAG: hypothetical protein IJF98_07815, partial [Firmicutes bacterium]|nr:hypothetical protein [Bacillota bacterium]